MYYNHKELQNYLIMNIWDKPVIIPNQKIRINQVWFHLTTKQELDEHNIMTIAQTTIK